MASYSPRNQTVACEAGLHHLCSGIGNTPAGETIDCQCHCHVSASPRVDVSPRGDDRLHQAHLLAVREDITFHDALQVVDETLHGLGDIDGGES